MRKFRLGITGGIGSGKSYISAILLRKGVPVYDTDSAAKRLMVSDSVIRSGIIRLLGEEAYEGGKLNKVILAQYIFSDKDNASRVNAIVHPRVYEDFLSWMDVQQSAIVGMESAILFESGFNRFVDKVLMVNAPFEVRLLRAMQRDNASRKQVLDRMHAQLDDTEKMKRSDFVIVNDGRCDVDSQVEALLTVMNKDQKNVSYFV